MMQYTVECVDHPDWKQVIYKGLTTADKNDTTIDSRFPGR